MDEPTDNREDGGIQDCLAVTLEAAGTIMGNSKVSPGLASVPPDTRTAVKCRAIHCGCLVISLLGGLGSDIAADLFASLKAVFGELHELASDPPSDVEGDTPRTRLAQIDSKLQMLSSAVQADFDVQETLDRVPELAESVNALVRAVLDRLVALEFPCGLDGLLAMVHEERSRMNAAGGQRSSITLAPPLASSRPQPEEPRSKATASAEHAHAHALAAAMHSSSHPSSAHSARAPEAAAVVSISDAAEQPEQLLQPPEPPRPPPAAAAQSGATAAAAPPLRGPATERRISEPSAGPAPPPPRGVVTAPVGAGAGGHVPLVMYKPPPPAVAWQKAVAAEGAAAEASPATVVVAVGGGAPAVAASPQRDASGSSPPAGKRVSGSGAAAAAAGGIGALLQARRLTAVAILTGVQQLADVQATTTRVVHASQVICAELERSEGTAGLASSTTADDVVAALHSSRGLDAAAGCLFRHWRDPLVALWVARLVRLVLRRASMRAPEPLPAAAHYSQRRGSGDGGGGMPLTAKVAPEPPPPAAAESAPQAAPAGDPGAAPPPLPVSPQEAADALILARRLERARHKAEWELRASFECANGTLQLLLALKEHVALPETVVETLAAIAAMLPLSEAEQLCRRQGLPSQVVALWQRYLDHPDVTRAVCELIRAAFGTIFDVDTQRASEAPRLRAQFIAAGLLPATVAALRAHESGSGGASELLPIATVLELVVPLHAGAWVAADGVAALVSTLRAHLHREPPEVALALCRVALSLVRASWMHPSTRRRLRDAGVPAVLEEARASGPSEAVREVATSAVFELAGGGCF